MEAHHNTELILVVFAVPELLIVRNSLEASTDQLCPRSTAVSLVSVKIIVRFVLN